MTGSEIVTRLQRLMGFDQRVVDWDVARVDGG